MHHTRRRKANKGAQAVVTKTMATVEEDKAKTIATIVVEGTNDGADDPDANKDGSDNDGDGDGGTMLVNESCWNSQGRVNTKSTLTKNPYLSKVGWASLF